MIRGAAIARYYKKNSFSSCPLRKHWSFIRTKNISSLLRHMLPGLLLIHYTVLKINSSHDTGQYK